MISFSLRVLYSSQAWCLKCHVCIWIYLLRYLTFIFRFYWAKMLTKLWHALYFSKCMVKLHWNAQSNVGVVSIEIKAVIAGLCPMYVCLLLLLIAYCVIPHNRRTTEQFTIIHLNVLALGFSKWNFTTRFFSHIGFYLVVLLHF